MSERYEELKRELAIGQQRLWELEERKVELESTLLRISGEMQTLEELGVGAGGAG